MIESLAVKALVAQLLLAIQGLSNYPMPERAPLVAFWPAETLQHEACGGPCNVLGWFPPGRTIYLDDRLDPLADLRARGILVHELVHFLQQESKTAASGPTCETWMDREREAFDVQLRWLTEQNAPRSAFSRFGRVPLRVACGPGPRDDVG